MEWGNIVLAEPWQWWGHFAQRSRVGRQQHKTKPGGMVPYRKGADIDLLEGHAEGAPIDGQA